MASRFHAIASFFAGQSFFGRPHVTNALALGITRLANIDYPALLPTLSAKADRLAFMKATGDDNLYKLPLARPGEFGGAPEVFAPSTVRDSSPNISFDGRKVVFGSRRTGAPEIYVADAAGHNVVRLTSGGAIIAGSPRFSPDGK